MEDTHASKLHDLMGEATRGIGGFRPDPVRLRRARRAHRMKGGAAAAATASAVAVVAVAVLVAPGSSGRSTVVVAPATSARQTTPMASMTSPAAPTAGRTAGTTAAPPTSGASKTGGYASIPAYWRGLPSETVITMLGQAGLDVSSLPVVHMPDSRVPAGDVLDVTDTSTGQSELGRTVAWSTSLTLVVSSGQQTISLPGIKTLIGLPCQTVMAQLRSLGFTNVETAVDPSAPAGTAPGAVTNIGDVAVGGGPYPANRLIAVYCAPSSG